MKVLPTNQRWNGDAAAIFRQFLSTPTGELLLLRIQAGRPPAIADGTLEQVALRGAALAGYESAVSTLLSLREADPIPTEQTNAGSAEYPPLEDDSKWKDE